MSTVAVFGFTGYAGKAITAELLDRGHRVVGVARSAGPDAGTDGLRVVPGSLHDEAVAAEAVREADVVVLALPAREVEGRKLIDAVPGLLKLAAGSGTRVGVLGGAASLRVAEDGPLLLDTPEFPAQFREEATEHKHVLELLRASGDGADWFYVSPAAAFGSYNPGTRTGSYRTGGDVLVTDDAGRSEISAEDLAIAFADEIERPAHRRERFTVAY